MPPRATLPGKTLTSLAPNGPSSSAPGITPERIVGAKVDDPAQQLAGPPGGERDHCLVNQRHGHRIGQPLGDLDGVDDADRHAAASRATRLRNPRISNVALSNMTTP